MTTTGTLCIALVAFGLAGGGALAQSTASDPAAEPGKAAPNTLGNTTPGKMQGSTDMSATPNIGAMKMSPKDAQTMKSCRAMAPDAMMADARCKAFMAKHPQAMNSGAPTPEPTPPK